MKACKDGSPWAHIASISSTVYTYTSTRLMVFCAGSAGTHVQLFHNKFAYDGAICVPMAASCICR